MTRRYNITSPDQVRALLARVPSPVYETLALVAGVALQANRNQSTSSTVKKWLRTGMPAATFQLVDAKLLLWERKIATWDDIVSTPLRELLMQKWQRTRGATQVPKTSKFKFAVIDKRSGNNCGDHSTRELAERRIDRLVAISNGRMDASQFGVEEIDHVEDCVNPGCRGECRPSPRSLTVMP